MAKTEQHVRGSKTSIAMNSKDAVMLGKFQDPKEWKVLPWEPSDNVRLLVGAAGARMLVRVSQESIQLTVKGVGPAVPEFASAAAKLVGHTKMPSANRSSLTSHGGGDESPPGWVRRAARCGSAHQCRFHRSVCHLACNAALSQR